MAFKICANGTCGVTVTDLNEYPTISTLTASGNMYYTFLESATINVLSSIAYNGDKEVQNVDVTTHYVSVNDATEASINVTDESEFDFPKDSLYEIAHIILPTKEYIDKYYSQVQHIFPNGVYFVEDGSIYKYLGYTTGTTRTYSVEKVEAEELIEVNNTGTTIIIETKNTFSICQLKDCYDKIARKLLEQLCGLKDCDAETKYSQDIFNRDLIWMAINVINYCIQVGKYFEAQRYLENIQACNAICNQATSNNKSSSSCGCNQ